MKNKILNSLSCIFRDVKCIADSPDFIAPEVIEKTTHSQHHDPQLLFIFIYLLKNQRKHYISDLKVPTANFYCYAILTSTFSFSPSLSFLKLHTDDFHFYIWELTGWLWLWHSLFTVNFHSWRLARCLSLSALKVHMVEFHFLLHLCFTLEASLCRLPWLTFTFILFLMFYFWRPIPTVDLHFHLHVHTWRFTQLIAQKDSLAIRPPFRDFGTGRVMMTMVMLMLTS